jgi:recombinase
MLWGYVRVSTDQQDETRQVQSLLGAGVPRENIIIEKASGKDFKRPLYKDLIDNKLKPFDTLYLTKLDRLGRNTDLLKEEIKRITEIRLCSLIFTEQSMLNYIVSPDNLKVDNNIFKSLLYMFISFISEWERSEMLERQKKAYDSLEKDSNGRMISRRTGKVIGREKRINSLTPEEKGLIKDWIKGKITASRVIQLIKISRPTLRKIKKEFLEEEIQL